MVTILRFHPSCKTFSFSLKGRQTGHFTSMLPLTTLNLFEATGHGNYAKSARLYLQEMNQLEHKYPWVFKNFMKGYHT